MDRRNSNSSDEPPSNNPNVFDDEYALDNDEDDFMPGVADGFRPMGMRDDLDGNRQHHDRNEAPRHTYSTPQQPETDLRRMATRNSIAKVPVDQQPPGHGSRTTTLQHRESVSSTASFATMGRSDSPLPSGPSHPYGMYPQNTVARSSSVATAPAQHPPPPPPVSRQGPTHPYGMYPQNTVEDEVPLPVVQAAIPVGFPGLPAGYHRQIGPDGEEQDIIGPDGHSEQLPPYTRYPEEGPTKAALAAEMNSTPIEAMAVPAVRVVPVNRSNDAFASPVSPTSSISSLSSTQFEAPLRPQLQPQEEQRRAAPVIAASIPVTASKESISEKQEPAGSVKAKNWRSKKLWGRVPMGVAVILLILVLIFAVILGAAIGTFVAKNKDKGPNKNKNKDKDHDDPAPQITGPGVSLFDATPISTPTSLPALPTGVFALPLGSPQESNPGCLVQPNQISAWSCKMTFAPLVLTVNTTLPMGGPPMASLAALPKPDGGMQYGLQSPALSVRPMQLVLDLDYKMYGPAYHFSAMYDKIVVLSPEEFAAGSSFNKRDGGEQPPFRHRFQVMPGENPWFCIWNATYIEGYIYVADNSSAAVFPTAWPSNAYPTSIPVETPAPTPTSSAAAGTTQQTTSPQRRGDDDYPKYPPYPRIVKIEERRLPGSPQPYCQKMLLLDNGQFTASSDNNGSPVIVPLQEQDPEMSEFFTSAPAPPASSATNVTQRKRQDQIVHKRTDPADACHCQWMFS